MNDITRTSKDRVASLAAKAEQAAQRAAAAKKLAQERCKHPYSALSFRNGATTTHNLDGSVEHSMTVMCSACDAWFSNKLVIHNDLY